MATALVIFLVTNVSPWKRINSNRKTDSISLTVASFKIEFSGVDLQKIINGMGNGYTFRLVLFVTVMLIFKNDTTEVIQLTRQFWLKTVPTSSESNEAL